MKSICIFGDSITQGADDTESGGWASRLKIFMYNKQLAELYVLGICGDDTQSLLQRFEIEAQARKPDVMLFAIGINDSYYEESLQKNTVTPTRFSKNIQALYEKAKKLTNTIIF